MHTDEPSTDALADELSVPRQALASMVAVHGALATLSAFLETLRMARAALARRPAAPSQTERGAGR